MTDEAAPKIPRDEVLVEVSRFIGRQVTSFWQLHPVEVEKVCRQMVVHDRKLRSLANDGAR